MVGHFAGHVEQLVLAGGLLVGDGRLDQMAGAVQFMAVLDVLPAILRLDERVIGVEIAVRLLGGGDVVDDGVGPLLQVGVALVGQRVGDAFEDLVDIGIVVERPSCLPFSSPAATAKFWMRPVISHWRRLASTVEMRLMRRRWLQKSSLMWTSGNGMGVRDSGLAAATGPAATIPRRQGQSHRDDMPVLQKSEPPRRGERQESSCLSSWRSPRLGGEIVFHPELDALSPPCYKIIVVLIGRQHGRAGLLVRPACFFAPMAPVAYAPASPIHFFCNRFSSRATYLPESHAADVPPGDIPSPPHPYPSPPKRGRGVGVRGLTKQKEPVP